MADMILTAGFILFAVMLAGFIIRLVSRGINIFDTPPINAYAFVCAKACAFGSCLFIPLAALFPSLREHASSGMLSWAALAVFVPGAMIALAAMRRLGDDLIFGLPHDGIQSLQTGGIFAFSRNPLYLGFILIIISSCMNTPHPVNITLGIIAVALHHLIVMREEQYLLAVRGSEYRAYMNKSGRYLPGL